MRLRSVVGVGEEVVVDTRPHWRYLATPTCTLVVIIAGGVAAAVTKPPVALGWLIVALLASSACWLAARYLRWATTRLIVTSARVIERKGFLARTSREIPIAAISNIGYRQTLTDRIIGAGDVVIESAGLGSEEVFPDLPRPRTIQNQVYAEIARWHSGAWPNMLPPAVAGPGRGPGLGGSFPSGPTSTDSDSQNIPSQIDQLDQLRRRGVITEAEFQAKKAQLLGRM